MKKVRVHRAKKEKQETKSPKFHPQKMELATDQPRRTVNVHDASQIHLKNGSYR